MLPIFALVIFLSAALLFLVQPMVAKLILPLLGGSPAVWNTCMVFFQAMLLGGYFYSHLLSKIRGVKTQAAVHILVLASAAIALPLSLPHGWNPPSTEGSPIPWLLALLAATAGLPYFAVSTTGPLLQRWFSRTDHPHATDPYFLYGASNAGSILGLLAYPIIIEPAIPLSKQGWVWTIGYALFGAGVALCAWLTTTRLRPTPAALPLPAQNGRSPKPAETLQPADAPPITWRRRLLWIILAAAPSSLMLGVTGYVSTDVAAVPLLWVIPLTLYLLSFILAFSPRLQVTPAKVSRLLVIAAIALSVGFLMKARTPLFAVIALHFGTFFVGAWMCHARLAASRPGASGLTEFYLWIAVGGVLGGSFNALLAPVIFPTFYEYPITLIAIMLLRVRETGSNPETLESWEKSLLRVPFWIRDPLMQFQRWRLRRPRPDPRSWPELAKTWVLWPVIVPLLIAFSLYGLSDVLLANTPIRGGWGIKFGLIGLPVVLCFILSPHIQAFAIGFAVLLSQYYIDETSEHGRLMHTERTFFGVYSVFDRPDHAFHILRHGTTVHGIQCMIADLRYRPLSYYFPTGPIGELFDVLWDEPKMDKCAFVGLGSGTLAAYGKKGRDITFFEIDPAVARIARNPNYFTFLEDSDSKPIHITLGDARQTLAKEPDGQFGLIALDAFSSDAIPVHLMTKEAVEMYLRKLRPDGVLAFHISNRYFDLAPVLGAIAHELNLVGYGRLDQAKDDKKVGKSDSKWVMLARHWEDLGDLNRNKNWSTVKHRPADPLWTDDFSNVMSVIEGWQ